MCGSGIADRIVPGTSAQVLAAGNFPDVSMNIVKSESIRGEATDGASTTNTAGSFPNNRGGWNGRGVGGVAPGPGVVAGASATDFPLGVTGQG